jgi:DNA-binding HxlR family transcriptional regulator
VRQRTAWCVCLPQEAEMTPSRQQTYACPVQLTIDIVGGKWKPLILWLLRAGRPRRFNDLQRSMPDVAHKVLTQHLRQLEQDGLVARSVVGGPHLQVEYCLTAFGTSLGPVLNEMAAWAKRHHRRFGATIGAPR